MDKYGNIYELSEAEKRALDGEPTPDGADGFDEEQVAQLRADVARLEGYLKGRADSDRPKRGKGANKDLVG